MWSPLRGAEPSASCGRTEAYEHTTIGRVPFPNCRSGVIGLAIAGNLENDGHPSHWQEAVGHELIPDTHKYGCTNEAATGLFVMLNSGSSRPKRAAGFPID